MAVEWLLSLVFCLPVLLLFKCICIREPKPKPKNVVVSSASFSARSPPVQPLVNCEPNEDMERTQETTPPKRLDCSSGRERKPVNKKKKTKKDEKSTVEEKEPRDSTKTAEKMVEMAADETQRTELSEKTAKNCIIIPSPYLAGVMNSPSLFLPDNDIQSLVPFFRTAGERFVDPRRRHNGSNGSCPPVAPSVLLMRTSIFGGCLILFFTFLVTAADPRSRRYAIEGSFWGVRTVTYKFATPCSSLSLEQLQRVFKKAFEVWEERTGLVFQYSPNADAHIDIIFATGAHGDGEPFDGRGKILAHAFFPRYGGDLHFDDEELWSEDKNGPGLDLYAVAVHEIGHALGLKHSHEPAAIMAPFYHTYTGEKLHLHFDDLAGIDRLYGSTGVANRKIGIVHGTRQDKPDMCRNGRIDAITQILNGTIYAFQGDYFWKLAKFPPVDDYFPVKISDVWNITGPIDAAMTNSNGHTYIFKGKDYYIFNKECKLLGGYPKTIRKGLVDTPDKISAATAWHEDGQPYFFKDNKYWKYSRWGMGTEWPKRISELIKGKVPKRIEAALHLRDTGTFLFSGGKYWQISGKRKYRFYPRSTSEDWFNCKRSLEN